MGTLALGLALDGSTEGVSHTETAVEGAVLVVDVHLIVGGLDLQMEIIAQEVVRIKSEAELPLKERVG